MDIQLKIKKEDLNVRRAMAKNDKKGIKRKDEKKKRKKSSGTLDREEKSKFDRDIFFSQI